ncbi:DUF934 domain-containing protein [Parvularcula sp. IMCC14364]|uniref:DUF934 domain-containing protein n=1 Tax=Parvularcula sp. IMCC14364 TaxID=3067902 RepID=UPI00274224C7|nr:DUF934 domain-containing protein [Parvularcula sp. IMCC14364]
MLLKLKDNRLEIVAGDDASLVTMAVPNDQLLDAETLLMADIIELRFPTFKDGRAYTQGRQLREQIGFTGDLRATGDIVRDQILYMLRCGFTSFDVPTETDVDGLNAALSEFSDFYQSAADAAQPIWMRRHAVQVEPVRRFA